MKKIDKNPEPQEWIEYRNTPGVKYEPIRALRMALYDEQGGICAYCNRRLMDEHDRTKQTTNVVEHVIPRNGEWADSNMEMTYSNMVLCCSGKAENEMFCDESKGSRRTHFSPVENLIFPTLRFYSSGKIASTNDNYQSDIDKVLNLNNPFLIEQRKAAIRAIIKKMVAESKKDSFGKPLIRRWIGIVDTRKNGLYMEYAGVISGYLKHRLVES